MSEAQGTPLHEIKTIVDDLRTSFKSGCLFFYNFLSSSVGKTLPLAFRISQLKAIIKMIVIKVFPFKIVINISSNSVVKLIIEVGTSRVSGAVTNCF